MLRRILLIITCIGIIFLIPNFSFAQYEQYYDVVPNITGCETGTLKQVEKDKVFTLLNKIRDLHKLPRFEYETAYDDETAETSLITVANYNDYGFSLTNHTPPNNWHCWSQTGYNGGGSSNLFWSSGTPTSESSIIEWLNDRGVPSLGHRRWILDPFIKKISFGRVDGVSINGSGNICGMTFYYDSKNEANLNSWNYDFVAFPQGDYPPSYFYKNAAISLTGIPIKSGRWSNNNKVIFRGTVDGQQTDCTIEMEDESGNITNYSTAVAGQVGTNYDGAGVPNVIYWYNNGLKEQETYQVRIKHVWVNGNYRDYNFEFTLRDPYITKPTACVLSQPQNNATGVNPNVTFQWGNSQGAAYYVIQIAKSNTFAESDIVYQRTDLSSTNLPISGVLQPMTKYYWRIAGRNDAGTGDWSPIWSFTTTTAPDPPALAGPANNAKDVSMTPTLSWSAADKADKYQVQISNSDMFTATLVDNPDITATSYAVEKDILTNSTKYFWRVRSISNISGPSTWTAVWNFTTASAAPGRPTLTYPAQGAPAVSGNLELRWEPVAGATSYNLLVSEESLYPEWALVVNETGITETKYKMPPGKLELLTQYYWKVAAVGPGGTSDWSINRRFTVGDASPVDENTVHDNSVSIYPNPISNNATLEVVLKQMEYLSLKIFNSLGENIETIIEGNMEPAIHVLSWDVSKLPSGVYYYQLVGTKTNVSGKFNVIK